VVREATTTHPAIVPIETVVIAMENVVKHDPISIGEIAPTVTRSSESAWKRFAVEASWMTIRFATA